MKKINLLIIISLIFASITTLFWESIRDLILKFNLPTGSYATSVVREILKENLLEPEIRKFD